MIKVELTSLPALTQIETDGLRQQLVWLARRSENHFKMKMQTVTLTLPECTVPVADCTEIKVEITTGNEEGSQAFKFMREYGRVIADKLHKVFPSCTVECWAHYGDEVTGGQETKWLRPARVDN